MGRLQLLASVGHYLSHISVVGMLRLDLSPHYQHLGPIIGSNGRLQLLVKRSEAGFTLVVLALTV